MPPKVSKSRNHQIKMNHTPAPPGQEKKPYRLSWRVSRQGHQPGFDVEMHRNTDREGAEEFAARWGVKMPAGAK